MYSKVRLSLITACVLFGTSALLQAEDLPHDERIKTGTLDNGLKWMFRQHDNPPGKVALMVQIKSGSLNETDAQRGLAHFMEHMCFNGTEHYPPGTLIKYFESIGMEFGADLNAFTGIDQTAYMLFLPDIDEQGIDKGLMTLSDYVFRASLLPEEIDKERGVVLAEWRTGQGAQRRVFDQELAQVFAGTRIAQRIPIGLPEVIEHAPYEEFTKYYRTWYHPELMTVMIVADAPFENFESSLKKWFGEYKPETQAPPQQKAGFKPFTEQRAFVITDPELGECTVKINAIEPGRPATTTVEQAREDLVEGVGSWILNRRLGERVQKGVASYQSASVGVADFFQDGVFVEGEAEGDSEDWSAMLDELIVEVVRACSHGFSERELSLAQKEILADAERAVETEPSRNARGMLFMMNRAVNQGEPISSAAQELEITKRLLPTLTLDEINAKFKAHFGEKEWAIVLNMPEKEGISIPSPDAVLAAAKASFSRETQPLQDRDAPTSILAEAPTPGKIVDTSVDEDLNITSAWLDNGVRVHHRYMDYKKDTVMVSIQLAGGQIEETKDTIGLTELAMSALRRQPATSRLSSTNVRDMMTGVNIFVSAGSSDDSFGLRVNGSPTALETGLQLAHALLTDGKIEDSYVKTWKQQLAQRRTMLERMPEFRAFETLSGALFGDDPRHQPLLPPERLEAITAAEAQAWYDGLRTKAPIEVAVVGEIDRDKAMELVAKYLGSLPKRERSASRLDALRSVKRDKGPFVRNVQVDTMTPKAMTLAGFIGCEEKNVYDTRALEIASHVLSSRLVETIREKLSLVYSLGAGNMPGDAYEDSGMFWTRAPCEPSKATEVVDQVHKIYQEFAEKGPTDSELENAKKQIENDLDEEMREPTYWLGVLRDLTYRNRSLADEKAEATAYKPYTADQVVEVFRKYYTPERTFKVTAQPAPQSTTGESEGSKGKADEAS